MHVASFSRSSVDNGANFNIKAPKRTSGPFSIEESQAITSVSLKSGGLSIKGKDCSLPIHIIPALSFERHEISIFGICSMFDRMMMETSSECASTYDRKYVKPYMCNLATYDYGSSITKHVIISCRRTNVPGIAFSTGSANRIL